MLKRFNVIFTLGFLSLYLFYGTHRFALWIFTPTDFLPALW